jgi:cytochrome c biogenesis factor
MNNTPYKLLNTPNLFNNLLFNSLNKYHPVFFFVCYLFAYRLNININFYSNYREQILVSYIYKNKYNVIILRNINYIWWLLLISLYLGSWWAIQEGSWGGWWNWDSSEVFGLLILSLYIFIIHSYSPYNYYINMYNLLVSLLLLILTVYFTLQLSYTLVSHNFGLNILDYGYTSFTFLSLLTTIIVIYSLIQYKIIFIKNYKYNFYRYNIYNFVFYKILPTKNLFKYTFTLLTLYLYLLSFNPIINNIFWTTFSVEFFNNFFFK